MRRGVTPWWTIALLLLLVTHSAVAATSIAVLDVQGMF